LSRYRLLTLLHQLSLQLSKVYRSLTALHPLKAYFPLKALYPLKALHQTEVRPERLQRQALLSLA
jgi:hypothetical protein